MPILDNFNSQFINDVTETENGLMSPHDKTKLNNIKIHNCTVDSDSSKECSNGEKAMCSNGGTTYTNCDDASKLKCPAHNGGDGAVVILW